MFRPGFEPRILAYAADTLPNELFCTKATDTIHSDNFLIIISGMLCYQKRLNIISSMQIMPDFFRIAQVVERVDLIPANRYMFRLKISIV